MHGRPHERLDGSSSVRVIFAVIAIGEPVQWQNAPAHPRGLSQPEALRQRRAQRRGRTHCGAARRRLPPAPRRVHEQQRIRAPAHPAHSTAAGRERGSSASSRHRKDARSCCASRTVKALCAAPCVDQRRGADLGRSGLQRRQCGIRRRCDSDTPAGRRLARATSSTTDPAVHPPSDRAYGCRARRRVRRDDGQRVRRSARQSTLDTAVPAPRARPCRSRRRDRDRAGLPVPRVRSTPAAGAN